MKKLISREAAWESAACALIAFILFALASLEYMEFKRTGTVYHSYLRLHYQGTAAVFQIAFHTLLAVIWASVSAAFAIKWLKHRPRFKLQSQAPSPIIPKSMWIETSGQEIRVPATRESIAQVVNNLEETVGESSILGGETELRYIQTRWTPTGLSLEFLEGSRKTQYRCLRQDFSKEEIVEAFSNYLDNNGLWRPRYKYHYYGRWYSFAYNFARAIGSFFSSQRERGLS